jgi:6-phosphogluconolactonase
LVAGTLEAFQTLSTLPEEFDGQNTCAQIHITPSGEFLYAANRGHDSIACFGVDTSSGHLTALGQQPTEPIPRTFGIDPQGRYLYAAGQGTGRLAAYRTNAQGTLEPLDTYAVGERPMWVLII